MSCVGLLVLEVEQLSHYVVTSMHVAWFQELTRQKDALAALRLMRGERAPADLEHDISQGEALVERLSQDRLAFESQFLKVMRACACIRPCSRTST